MEINGGCVYGCFSLGGGVEGVSPSNLRVSRAAILDGRSRLC
jgi:hypothetical protein